MSEFEPSFMPLEIEQEEQKKKNKKETHMDSHDKRKEEEWKNGENIMSEVYKNSKNYFENLPDLSEAFKESHELACCMDEGAAHMKTDRDGKLFMAGSGILFPASSVEERLDKVARMFIKLGVKEVTSHESCGAAKLAFVRDNPGLDLSKVEKHAFDDYGKEWSQALVKKINELSKDGVVRYNHINAEEMERPKEFHDARVAYVDGTGKFNPDKVTGLPHGFVVDFKDKAELGGEEGKAHSAAELKVALDIAFGDHGFGKRFTSENPFVILVVGRDEIDLKNLEIQAKEVAVQSDLSRIKIEGFIAPQQQRN